MISLAGRPTFLRSKLLGCRKCGDNVGDNKIHVHTMHLVVYQLQLGLYFDDERGAYKWVPPLLIGALPLCSLIRTRRSVESTTHALQGRYQQVLHELATPWICQYLREPDRTRHLGIIWFSAHTALVRTARADPSVLLSRREFHIHHRTR